MTPPSPTLLTRSSRWFWLSLIALISMLLVSCGGGTDLAAGPGTGGTGTRDGFVTGFGSVYINGEKFDNSQVQPTQALSADQTGVTTFALGQRVSIEYDTATGLIKTAKLKPLLVGPVESVDAKTGWLQVLGQPVFVASAQNPYADQPGHITQLVTANGQAAPSLLDLGLKPGDWVELHGQWLNNMPSPLGAASVTPTTGLLASRLQVLSAARSQALLTGQVDRIEAGVGSVRTSDGRQLEFDAQGNGLTAGQTAQVWVSAADLTQWHQGGSASPRAVGDQAQAGPSTSSTEGMVIMGTPSAWSASTRQLTLNGQTFELPETLLTPTVRTALNEQPLVAHIQLELSRSNAAPTWQVKRITLASAVPLLAPQTTNMDPRLRGDDGMAPRLREDDGVSMDPRPMSSFPRMRQSTLSFPRMRESIQVAAKAPRLRGDDRPAMAPRLRGDDGQLLSIPALVSVMPSFTSVIPAFTTVVPGFTAVISAFTTVISAFTTVVPGFTVVIPAQAGIHPPATLFKSPTSV